MTSPPPVIFPGDVYGELTVIEELPERRRGCRAFLCKCSCNAETRVRSDYLKSGKTRSCGHLRREATRASNTARTTHGHKRAGRRSPTYSSWHSMKQRCLNPNTAGWEYYGGRGLTIAPEWLGPGGFERFLADLGPRPEGTTLDRIDVDGNYEPGNVRWSTPKVQANNRRLPRRVRQEAVAA